MEDVKRRIRDIEDEQRTIRLILSGDLNTVGLIENVRNLTALVGEMRGRQDDIAGDITDIKKLEETRTNIREGEERAAKRLRRFLYLVGTIMLGGTGTVLGYLGKLLTTVGSPFN